MKNLLFIFALTLGVSFVSCGSKTTETTASADSTVVDTTVVDTTVVDSITVDSIME